MSKVDKDTIYTSKGLHNEMKVTYRQLAISALIMICTTTFAFANSSWHWVSEMRPFDVLPWVVIPTLVIEIAVLCWCTKDNYIRVGVYVILANLLSFVAPFFIDWSFGEYQILGYDFERFLNHTPRYIVGLTYGILTLAVELPVLYRAFKHRVSEKKLVSTIIAVNVITTALVFVIERIVCQGTW
jgi:hypothetical protein